MKQVIYAMQFKGSAIPKAAYRVILAVTKAPSCTLSSVVGPGCVTVVYSSDGGVLKKRAPRLEIPPPSVYLPHMGPPSQPTTRVSASA
jgi:hypothetical protein